MAYQLNETDGFRRCLDDYAGQPAVHKAWGQLQAQLRRDPYKAQSRKLEGTRVDLYRSKIDDGRRVVWAVHEQSVVLLLFGEHDDVYDKARRITTVDHTRSAVRYAEEEVRHVRHVVDSEGLLAFLTDRELLLLGVQAEQVALARAVEDPADLEALRGPCGEDVVTALTLILEGASFEDVRTALRTGGAEASAEDVQQLLAQAVDDVATTIGSTLEEQLSRSQSATRQRIAELEQRFGGLAEAFQNAERDKVAADQRNRELAERLAEVEAARSRDAAALEAADRAADEAKRAVATAEMRAAAAQAAAQREATAMKHAAVAVRESRDAGNSTPAPTAAPSTSSTGTPGSMGVKGSATAKKKPKKTAAKNPVVKVPAKSTKILAANTPDTADDLVPGASPPLKHLVQQALDRLKMDASLTPSTAPTTGSIAAPAVGSRWTGPTTGRAYSLLLSAEVVDRNESRYLTRVLAVEHARAVAKRLLTGRPEGGRITVNRDGHVFARRTPGGPLFSVGRVTADEWFPGHVTYRPQPVSTTVLGGLLPDVRPPFVPPAPSATGTVPAVMNKLWGFALVAPVPQRFQQTGWTYEGFIHVPCHRCGTALAELRKPMTGGNRGKRYWALVCTTCPDVFVPDEIDAEHWQHRKLRWSGPRTRAPRRRP